MLPNGLATQACLAGGARSPQRAVRPAVNPPRRVNTLQISPDSSRRLRKAFVRIMAMNLTDEDEIILHLYRAVVACLTDSELKAIGNFQLRAGQPGSPAYLIVTGLPSDDELPPTPEGEPTCPPQQLTSLVVLAVARLIGQPYAFEGHKGGYIVQDVRPTKGKGATQGDGDRRKKPDLVMMMQTNAGSVELDPHVEDHEWPAAVRADYLLLGTLRTAPCGGATNIVIPLAHILADERMQPHLPVLFEEKFKTGDGGFDLTGEEEQYLGPHALVFGTPDRPTGMFLDCTGVIGMNTEAAAAVTALKKVCYDPEVQVRYFLAAGDVLIVDNKRAMHARTSFEPAYDGNDRWLQRVRAKTDLSSACDYAVGGRPRLLNPALRL